MNGNGYFITNKLVQEYVASRVRDPGWDWRRPIDFWGIVVGDDDGPIGDANVELKWNDDSFEGTSAVSIKTDNNGKFKLQGKRGKCLTVRVWRDGYRACRWGVIGFEYANPSDLAYHRPDPERPVLFRLIRKGPPEPLVKRYRMDFRMKAGSEDLHLDLLGQRAVPASEPGVDLVVHAEHGPIREEGRDRWYDWKVVLSVPNGGIQAGTECPPAAPEDGYQPSLEIAGKVEANPTPAEVYDWFFIKSRGGQHFARIHISVVPAPSEGGSPKVYLAEYVLNPAGSRGLEFYDEMQVEQKYYVSPDPNYVPPPRN